ncbi:hypothetical protein AAMO2058_000982600 [Amorphochlora amoebiformis]|uniref:NAD(P)-binding domain-containing protein n=1 Tax=Amorphochlora amoebiformis TaxID=1561963 RepID=A0A7S0DAB8_9EUKA|mmetsp:Transcript_22568/g.35429  ORF Transcript_22568/g.35429 Transcript_22568/m.35429 type:complete len:359 (+) Transcript_22568:53-1129(+)
MGSAVAKSFPYQPKSVLITGGAGFIASNVTIRLVTEHPYVNFVVLDKMDYCANIKNLDPVKDRPNFKFVKGDILSADLVNFLVKRYEIDTIFHFAAQTHVDNSFGNSLTFTENNVLGTHTLLECWRANQKQIRRFIHVSTDEVYGENKESTDEDTKSDKFDEANSMLLPTNPYAASKAAAELMVRSYQHSFNIPAIITRGNNVYGPRQYPEKLIPKFICRLSREQKLCVHGKGTPRRSYLYVEDAARAYEKVLFYGETGETYNVGTKDEISVLEVTKAIIKAFGLEKEEKKWIDFVADRHFNDQRYYISIDKLEKMGWKPLVSFDEGIKKTIAWYKNNSKHWNDEDLIGALVPHPRRH